MTGPSHGGYVVVTRSSQIAGISLAETGALATETFTLTLTDTSGLLSYVGNPNPATTTLKLSGTLATIQGELADITDTEPALGTDTITLSATDQYGSKSLPVTIKVTTLPFPAITAPATATVGVGQTNPIAGISLAETGATTGEIFTVTLGDSAGILSLSQAAAAGSTVSAPGTLLTITGTLAEVNTDLAYLQDKDTTAGSDNIDITATDANDTPATPATVAVTVNAAPDLTLPAGQGVAADIAALLTGLSLAESGNSTGETFTINLAGNLATSGITLGAPSSGHYGTDSLTFSGSLATVNTDLADIYYRSTTPDEVDNIVITTTDSFGNQSAYFYEVETAGLLSISAVSTITLPHNPNGAVIDPGTIAEPPSFVGEIFTLTLQDTTGLLSLNPDTIPYPLTLTGNDTTKLTMSGAIYAINDALPLLTDVDTANDTITLTASDSLGQTATPAKIAVSIEAAPVITAPATAVIGSGKLDPIKGVSLAESGATSGELFTVTITDAHGDLSFSSQAPGTTVTGSGTAKLTVLGTLAEVNSTLATLEDIDATTGTDKISLSGSDNKGNIGSTASIAVTVNGAPQLIGPSVLQVSVQAPVTPSILNYAVTESGSTANETFSVTLTDSHGVFPASSFSLSGSESGAGTNDLTISGPLSAVNSDLAAVSYKNTTQGSDTITEKVSDSLGGETIYSVGVTVNGAPSIVAPPSLTWENPSFGNDAGSIAEAGNTSGEIFGVSISDASATFFTFDNVVSGNNTNDLTLQSTLANINNDLDDIFCTAAVGTTDAVTLKVTDSLGGSASATFVFTIVAGPGSVGPRFIAASPPRADDAPAFRESLAAFHGETLANFATPGSVLQAADAAFLEHESGAAGMLALPDEGHSAAFASGLWGAIHHAV